MALQARQNGAIFQNQNWLIDQPGQEMGESKSEPNVLAHNPHFVSSFFVMSYDCE